MNAFDLKQLIKEAVGWDSAKWIAIGTNGKDEEAKAIYIQNKMIKNYPFIRGKLNKLLKEHNLKIEVRELGKLMF